MIGVIDFGYQNIIFVHDYVFIFLILVFCIIIAFFIIALESFTRQYIYESLAQSWYEENLNKKHNIKKKFIKKINIWLNGLKVTHNLILETIWTFLPIIIVLELIFPSLSLIAEDDFSNKLSIQTVNVMGNQWYWSYELNIISGIVKQISTLEFLTFENTSNKLDILGYHNLLTTSSIFIPVGVKTSFFITSNDVAHSWAIPGMGIKVDAIPGRINLKNVIASRVGLYSGMCSELCGIEHGFMPISLQVLTLSEWYYNIEYSINKIKVLSTYSKDINKLIK